MNVTDFNSVPAAVPAAPADAARSASSNEDRFLTLLVAQMKNQDPLNPLDNAQVTSQLAQLSTVSGIDKLNATLNALAGSFAQTQSLQAAALIGHDVLVEGSALALSGGAAVGGYSLDGDADQVTLTIKDLSGNTVHTAQLGAQQAGLHGYAWDGATDAGAAAAEGRYTASIAATRPGGTVAAHPLSAGRVLGVSQDSGATALDVSGLGRQPYSAVKQIL